MSDNTKDIGAMPLTKATQKHFIGTDPEVFLVNNDGKMISSIDLIGGSKEFPRPIDDEGSAVQEDNVAVEYNIAPCQDVESFIARNRKVLQYLSGLVASQGLSLSIKPSAVFDKDQLSDPRAKVFGCEPDFNAWKGGSINPRPNAKNKSLRSAGGHIHVGFNGENLDPNLVIKAMDLFIGVGMMKYDDDKDRRQLYGKAGACRYKSYGVEYRTPSNAWLQSDETIRYVWQQQERALEFVRSGEAEKLLTDDGDLGARIQECINESNMDLYKELAEEFQL